MIENYLKTAFRNLLRYKGFAAINIASLTIGIIGCLVIGLFVWDEWQFDKDIPGGENVYRIYEVRKDMNTTTYYSSVPPAFATFLKQQYPEVEVTSRMLMIGDKYLVEVNENRNYEEKGWFVDASFFQIFPFQMIEGNPNTALDAPSTIVLSQQMAQRYFGKESALGRTIKINKEDFEVKGVFAPLPDHFHLDLSYLMSLPSAGLPKERMDKWTWHQFYTYVRFKPGANVSLVQDKFQAHVKKEVKYDDTQVEFIPYFQALKDIHLQSANFSLDNAIRGNATYVRALSMIALFLLIIACFNFINLATARSFKRAKEIGIRKVVGAYRQQLIAQFIGETVLLSLFSMILATVAVLFIVPSLNHFTGKNIEFNPFTNPLLGLLLMVAGIIIGILAGIYPAMILSGFQPIKVLKSMKLAQSDFKGALLRKSLVVVQFALSVLLIVSTIIVYRQTQYFNNKDLGFDKEQVLTFPARGEVTSNIESFKDELRRLANVVSVTSGYGLPGDQFAGDGVLVPGDNGDQEYSVNLFIGDYDYIKTLGLRLIAGRDFSREMATDESEAFIINETAVQTFGFKTAEQAIGHPLNWKEWSPADSLKPIKKGKVIGVVKDFHYKSLHDKVSASVIQLYPQVTFKVAVKLKTSDMRNSLAFIRSLWNKFSPGYPLDYKFLDESYGKMYKSEEKLGSLLWFFSIMAIVVGCMGLFALAALSAEEKTKEIGIRKVLGASVFQIMGLLSKSFLSLVLLACVIAVPVAWLAINKWLEDYAYRSPIEWWVFLLALLLTASVALLTISYQTIKAAVMNPVKALRTE